MELASLLIVGLLLGMRHALEPDHLASVASISGDDYSILDSIKHGAIWGLGHSVTLFIFGGLVLVLGDAVPERLAGLLELVVGVMLVVLGADALRRAAKSRIHLHSHDHSVGERHLHAHTHQHSEQHEHLHSRWRALLVGLMHGMAGSAALVLLAVASAPSAQYGLLYILVFGVGSLMGMAILSIGIAVPLRESSKRSSRFSGFFRYALGVLTIFLGLSIVRTFLIGSV